jgi:hypothetical protein
MVWKGLPLVARLACFCVIAYLMGVSVVVLQVLMGTNYGCHVT